MNRRNEVSVGILITVAVIVVVLGTLWLVRGGLKSGYPLYTRFQWGQNLKQGQPVLLAGVSVGYVGDVNLRRDGYLDVMLRIDDQYTVPKGSKALVKPVGIFGDVAVALQGNARQPLAEFRHVHAVAAIGNPQRFFASLRAAGIDVIEHAFDDHHAFAPAELDFADDLPLLMTDKDAIKCTGFAQAHWWRVPVRAELSAAFYADLLARLASAHGSATE